MTGPPDSWIERHWLDHGPHTEGYEFYDMDPRCDKCDRAIPDYTESGMCRLCDLEWDAAHQLTSPVNLSVPSPAEPHISNGEKRARESVIESSSDVATEQTRGGQSLSESAPHLVGLDAVLKYFTRRFGRTQ